LMGCMMRSTVARIALQSLFSKIRATTLGAPVSRSVVMTCCTGYTVRCTNVPYLLRQKNEKWANM